MLVPIAVIEKATLEALGQTLSVNCQRNAGTIFTEQRIAGPSRFEMSCYYGEVSDSDLEMKQMAFSPAEKLELKVQLVSMCPRNLIKDNDNSA